MVRHDAKWNGVAGEPNDVGSTPAERRTETQTNGI